MKNRFIVVLPIFGLFTSIIGQDKKDELTEILINNSNKIELSSNGITSEDKSVWHCLSLDLKERIKNAGLDASDVNSAFAQLVIQDAKKAYTILGKITLAQEKIVRRNVDIDTNNSELKITIDSDQPVNLKEVGNEVMEVLTQALVAKVQASAKDKELALNAQKQAEELLAQTQLDAQKKKYIAMAVGILATLVSAGVSSWAGVCQASEHVSN